MHMGPGTLNTLRTEHKTVMERSDETSSRDIVIIYEDFPFQPQPID